MIAARLWRVGVFRALLGLLLLPSWTLELSARPSRQALPSGEVYLIRGVFGIDGGISDIRNELLRRGIQATAYDPGEWGGLSAAIANAEASRQRHAPVVLVGYSLGGQNVIALSSELAQAGIPVDLLIVLDAPDPIPIPANVRQVFNFYQTRARFWRGQPLTASASFRGRLVNRNVDSIPTIEHHDFARRPEISSEVVRQVLQAVRR